MSKSAVVAWLDPGTVAGGFAESLAKLVAYSAANRCLAGLFRFQSGPLIEDTRNSIVTDFLDSDVDWLLMVDSDMTFQHDALERLLEAADPDTAPVVGGLCFGYTDTEGPFPTMYRWDGHGLAVIRNKLDGDVYPVDGTGAAFLLVHRDVFKRFRRDDPLPWFRRSLHDGILVGEDLTFCLWLRQHDVPIYVHTGVETGHVKQFTWNRDSYHANRGDYETDRPDENE